MRDAQESRGLGDVYKRQGLKRAAFEGLQLRAGEHRPGDRVVGQLDRPRHTQAPVSYTHLTLPTTYSV